MKKLLPGQRLMRFSFSVMRKMIKFALLIIGGGIWLKRRREEHTKDLAMREAQSRMNEFLSIASHELKTPLTSIKGNVQLVGRRLKKTQENESEEAKRLLAEARDLLDRTDQQISRLTRLVNSLLETARISGNTMDLLFELCELNQIVEDVTQNTQHIPANRSFEVRIPEDRTLLVMADPTRIKHVVVHFLSNAHKFSPLERPIEVSLNEEGNQAKISVRDEGPGIALEEQKNIWERFYRAPGTEVLNGSEVGLGLGLHISRSIIEQHHGQIGLYSTPGKGSTFWFTLPLAEAGNLI